MPDDTLSILAILTVRNEGAFLIDWLAHHKAMGFTDFLVFSNNCTDGTDAILDRLETLGLLHHVRNDGPHPKGPQWEALRLADRHPAKARADWVMVLDIDEYVNVHAGGHRLADLFAALPDATAIPLTWRLFGNGGIRAYEDRPVTEQFTRAAPSVMGWPWRAAMFKTLFRNDGAYEKLGVHRPRQPDRDRMACQRWYDGSGRPMPPAYHTGKLFSHYGRDNYRLAQLNHYALGSMESYVLKCDRGRANRDAAAFDMGYWVERNLCDAEDRTALALEPLVKPMRDGLRADPVLSGLHDKAVGWRHARFNELMRQEEWRSLFGRLLMSPVSRVPSNDEHQFLANHALSASDDMRNAQDNGTRDI